METTEPTLLPCRDCKKPATFGIVQVGPHKGEKRYHCPDYNCNCTTLPLEEWNAYSSKPGNLRPASSHAPVEGKRWESEADAPAGFPLCPWCLSGNDKIVTRGRFEFVYHRTMSDFCPLHGSDGLTVEEWKTRGLSGVALKRALAAPLPARPEGEGLRELEALDLPYIRSLLQDLMLHVRGKCAYVYEEGLEHTIKGLIAAEARALSKERQP